MKASIRGFISEKLNNVRETSTITQIGWKNKGEENWNNCLVCVPKRLQEAWGNKINGKDLVNLKGEVLFQNKQVVSAKFIETLGGLDIPDEAKLIVAAALKSHIYTEHVPMLMVREFSKLYFERKEATTTETSSKAAAATDIAAQIAAMLGNKAKAVA